MKQEHEECDFKNDLMQESVVELYTKKEKKHKENFEIFIRRRETEMEEVGTE